MRPESVMPGLGLLKASVGQLHVTRLYLTFLKAQRPGLVLLFHSINLLTERPF
jgi:hypothetical protein